MKPKKILHVITGLNTGGAETALFKLLSKMNRNLFESEVISLTNIGPIGRQIREIGIPVTSLELNRRFPNPYKFYELVKKIKKSNSDLIQTWMYHADLIGGWAAKLATSSPVIWNIRHSDFHKNGTKRMTNLVVGLCRLFSRRIPNHILSCSETAKNLHIQWGYPADKTQTIPNGFDLDVFRPDPLAYRTIRQELKIPEESILIGLIGRFHPQKDHLTFIRAASKLAEKFDSVAFVLCGDNMTWENPKLRKWIGEDRFRERFFLLGRRDDIPRITASLDIAVSSSLYGEGFPNTIGEAMSCGIPCVVTDVGDSASLVGETGIVVPPGDPDRLANGLERLILSGKEERGRLGEMARERIRENFSLPVTVRCYEDLYLELS